MSKKHGPCVRTADSTDIERDVQTLSGLAVNTRTPHDILGLPKVQYAPDGQEASASANRACRVGLLSEATNRADDERAKFIPEIRSTGDVGTPTRNPHAIEIITVEYHSSPVCHHPSPLPSMAGQGSESEHRHRAAVAEQ